MSDANATTSNHSSSQPDPEAILTALQQQEQHFRIALQTANMGSWEHDLTTGILTCSARCKANFGLPPDAEFTHETLFAALHPDDRPIVQAAIQRSIQTQTDYEVEERCYHPDGSLHWILVRGQLVYNASGQPIRMVGVTLDITEKKHFEASLRASNQRVFNILESITDAFVAFDRDWRYTYVNPEAVRLLGRSAEELLGQRWRDIFPEAAQPHSAIVQQMQQAMAEQITLKFEAFSVITNCWLDISLFPSSSGLAMYFRDISDRRRAAQRRDIQYAITRILAEAATVADATPAILQALCEHLDWQIGILWGVAPDAPVLHYINCWQAPHTGVQDFVEASRETTFPREVGVPGKAWANRQPVWISRLDQDSDFLRARLATQVGLQSAFWFPIQLGTEVLGVIECCSCRIQQADPDLLQMVAAIGSQIGQFMERKRSEAELQQRETELRLITNALPVLISFVDAEQRYRFSNQRYEEWFGRPASEVHGKYLWEVLGDETYAAIRPYVEQVLRGEAVSFERKVSYKAGDARNVLINYVPRFDHQGKVEGFVALVNDITSRKQAEETLRQSEERLRIAQQSANAGVWDWDITTNRVIWSEEYYRLYGLDPTTTAPSYENWLNSVIEADRDLVNQAAQEALEQKIDLNVEFRILHPIQGERWLTAIGQTLFDAHGQPQRMTGIALDITHRKQVEKTLQASRAAAEAAEQRAKFLAEASKILSSSLDFECTLRSVAQAVVPTLADWCAVDILKEDGRLERLATTHTDPAKVQWGMELYRRYPPDLNAPHGIAQVLRTGQSGYYPTISDDQIAAAARDPEHLQILQAIGFSSAMLVPLNARGKTLGVISLIAAESGRSYSLEDLSLAEELSRRAAIALDNAYLYWKAQQARQAAEQAANRTTRLQAVTAALSESLTPVQVAEVIVEQSMAALEADGALMALLKLDGRTLEVVRAVGYDISPEESRTQFSIDSPLPLAEAVRTGQAVWAEPLADRLARYPHLAETYKRFPFEAWISLPLVVEGKAVGGLSLSFTRFKLLNQDDRDFILALSRQCAQAIVRAQLYEAEQWARAEAERANRIKDEFLAVLSHELRSPLNPILGWSKLLQTRKFDPQATKRALETIERNAKLQTQLIDDLLDVSRILRGKLVLNVQLVNLEAVIDAALETVQLSAEAKSIRIQKVIPSKIAPISGDAGRLQQIVWNLLSNAVKFTPPGGQVEIRLDQIDRSTRAQEGSPSDSPTLPYAQITVSDTGKGIAPDFLPHVFEYFRQEDSTTTRKFGGLGLGLAIVRYLTELHSGTIQAESPGEGFGATFTVWLPIAKQGKLAHSDRSQTPSSGANLLSLNNYRVLVVDDEADMRVLIVSILEQTGLEIKVVASAIEALEILNSFKPDALISDIGMPGVDGYELMRQIRRLPPAYGGKIPAIALTAYAGELNQQKALAAGFQAHLSNWSLD